ncbi:negative regulation of histone ubiquitination [Fragilaria crotonensis]|nr:negative regulation of histone ubiquitination [Fragilaria crotonensis]
MRLQEAKVNVGPLRQRMTALRGRAVELVSEAFSGGAEDPTALQLQADELYGMEEALGARVHAAFRAQGWRERSLQCAKAAVRRDKLLSDAATVMERYAGDSMIRQRRLEIRFSGESGFDAASGDEAGVTRGFFADVAEALLCCQHVSPSTHRPSCPPDFGSSMQTYPFTPTNVDLDEQSSRLPLWIPDLDSTGKVVIPTPRANSRSTPGVYPRPLSQDDPQMEAVKEQFRFMGRVFACALRERFMFPLPLSCSFLRLVQIYAEGRGDASLENNAEYGTPRGCAKKTPDCTASRPVEDDATDEYSLEENTPTTGSTFAREADGGASRRRACDSLQGLVSLDLPRPGFLGGEVYAVEQHICTELDVIDAMNLSESETAKRYAEVAANPKFAQTGFGKSYECSFEEYMEGKTFVDPLDSSQGPLATPLCTNGHEREVNIFNVREWVRLAKQFILVDGVIEQAKAFREGVDDFFPTTYLRLFTVSELQRDVCGGSDNVDQWNEEDIRRLFKMDSRKVQRRRWWVSQLSEVKVVRLSRRFASSSPTIGFLSKTLLRAHQPNGASSSTLSRVCLFSPR